MANTNRVFYFNKLRIVENEKIVLSRWYKLCFRFVSNNRKIVAILSKITVEESRRNSKIICYFVTICLDFRLTFQTKLFGTIQETRGRKRNRKFGS